MKDGTIPVAGSNGVIGFHNTSLVDSPAITVGRSGSVGKVHYYDTPIWPHNTSLYVDDFKGNNPMYIYYLLRLLDLEKLCDNSVVPSLNRNFVYPLKVPFIKGEKRQEKTIKILKIIDGLIGLKRKENTILESIAKQIYDYWFVQFDFPNEDGKPYKSSGGKMVWNETLKREIPEGWNDTQLGDVLICNNESTTQGKHLEGLPYCPIDEIPIRKMSFAGGKNWNEANSSLQLYKKKDILIGAMRVYFHRCCIAAENGITRTTTLVLKPYDKELLGYFYQICNEERAFSYANQVSAGTQQPYVTWNSLAKYYFPYPNNPSLIRKYSKKVDTIIDLVITNVKEINALQSLRDYLLPLLMNGQVTIKD